MKALTLGEKRMEYKHALKFYNINEKGRPRISLNKKVQLALIYDLFNG